jgi:DNA-directed RNA polymerase subunit RPC12/RpoP
MPMPRQLRNSKRRRPRHSEPRPTIELMPAININELRHAIPRYSNTINEPNVTFKYLDIARLRLSTFCLEITGRNGHVQRFRIVWIPTYFGRHRAILVCSSCGRRAIRLFSRYGNYACRHCHRAQYLSQKQNATRKRLAACKLRLKLGGLPDIREPLPPKAKWKHKRRYQALRNQVQTLEAKAKQTRFRKEIDIRTFAYHVT